MQREHSTGGKPVKWRLRLNRARGGRNVGIRGQKVSGLGRPVSASRLAMLISLRARGGRWLIPSTLRFCVAVPELGTPGAEITLRKFPT